MPPKSSKQATKGQKQILQENAATLRFYLYIICAVNIIYAIPTFFLFWDSLTAFYMALLGITTAVYCGSYQFMSSMARATYAADGTLLDGGIDLNMKEGMAEHMKDLILLTAGVQVLSLCSNWMWLFLLLAPSYAGYLLWVNILAPWIFAEPPEVDEKKAKKLDRRMRRQ